MTPNPRERTLSSEEPRPLMVTPMICPKTGSPSPRDVGALTSHPQLVLGGMEGCGVTPTRIHPPSALLSTGDRVSPPVPEDTGPSPEPNGSLGQASATSLGTSTQGTLRASLNTACPRSATLQRGPPKSHPYGRAAFAKHPRKALKPRFRGEGCSHHPEPPPKPLSPPSNPPVSPSASRKLPPWHVPGRKEGSSCQAAMTFIGGVDGGSWLLIIFFFFNSSSFK